MAETIRHIFAAAACVLAAACGNGTVSRAERALAECLEDVPARVGVYAETDDGRAIAYRADEFFPMLSTFKFPVALAVMEKMRREGTPLAQRLDVEAERLETDTYSPLRDSIPDTDFDITLDRLLYYSVSLSDNNACDILIGYAGGIDSVARYVAAAGIDGMTLKATEKDMHADIENQRLNACTPRAAVRLLAEFADGRLLAPPYSDALMRYMTETATGADKLRAGLPRDAALSHKTGSSDRTPRGVKIADNDMGIVRTPEGRRYAIAVFISDSRLDDSRNAALTARISRIVHEAFDGKE